MAKRSEKDATSDDGSAESDTEEDENVEEDRDQDGKEEGGKGKKKSVKGLDGKLPPIHDLESIFVDLVDSIPEIKDVATRIAGRSLRVATMCSGTEAPLLALQMIQRAVKQLHQETISIDHVFSCEIEPFKQAYIERNFQPPILFRDIRELGDEEARTAYGALVPVPGNIDLLVAGTSCVDFSSLNAKKKSISEGGKSGQTFDGMLAFVARHKPLLVILENVYKAPWNDVKKLFEDEGYSAEDLKVDTKNFYIPQTRQRGYLFAVNKTHSSVLKEWTALMKGKLTRRASSTFDEFLLPSDDPRIHQARQRLSKENSDFDHRERHFDWTKCQERHDKTRFLQNLGTRKPLTVWEEGGSCKLPDYGWNDWAVRRVERDWDVMDISYLQSAFKGVDPAYKTLIWNLSQNVDRGVGSKLPGIAPCLTPNMIAYITNRGGPLTGLEALSLQGLPIDRLNLSRESEGQLMDLAGNAMSTTAVGANMLAALVAGKNLLKDRHDGRRYISSETGERKASVTHIGSSVTVSPSLLTEGRQTINEDSSELSLENINLSAIGTGSLSFPELLVQAQRSARLCPCEGRTDITKQDLYSCKACGITYCKSCSGRPEHEPRDLEHEYGPRLFPDKFARGLKLHLPMGLSLQNVDQGLLNSLKVDGNTDDPENIWTSWCEAVLRASQFELRFVELKRQEVWSAVYDSPTASLELLLHSHYAEWRLFAKALTTEPANAYIRSILKQPIGRLLSRTGILSGTWEFALPFRSQLSINMKGIGEKVPSWESRIGLLEHANTTVHPSLVVEVSSDDGLTMLDRDIGGEYDYLPKCGTANGSLHKRKSNNDGNNSPVFLLLDPHHIDNSKDRFVFSTSMRRYEYNESRPLLCSIDSVWRPSSNNMPSTVTVPCRWAQTQTAKLDVPSSREARFKRPNRNLPVSLTEEACRGAKVMLSASVDLRGQVDPFWPTNSNVFRIVDDFHQSSVLKALSWLLERVKDEKRLFSHWNDVSKDVNISVCQRCAPCPPAVEWQEVGNNKKRIKTVPVENAEQARKYESLLKNRPKPFAIELKVDENGIGHVRVGLNITSLLHKGHSLLPSRTGDFPVTLSWRLDSDFTPSATQNFKRFTLNSNKHDGEHSQPVHFKRGMRLRPEQLRSLDWMVKQELLTVPQFREEEVTEACLHPLNWRAEGRASRLVRVRGGVLADEVGYGKTVITLGLIGVSQGDVKRDFKNRAPIPGKLHSSATVVIVPGHLPRQWRNEAEKFTGEHFKTEVITSMSQMNKLKIKDITGADLIIVSSTLFKSDAYLANLADLAGTTPLPTKEGRHFDSRLRELLDKASDRTELLRSGGADALLDKMAERTGSESSELAEPRSEDHADANESVPGPSKKRKPGNSKQASAKKKQKVAKDDPWKLKSDSVKENYKMMQAPAFEMFHFGRIVVDEYTYMEGKIHSLVTKLTSDRKWILSGTPPIHDFASVKTISAFLDIHLGIDDKSRKDSSGTYKPKDDLSDVEKFIFFKENYTNEWHAGRQEVAQRFLNQFVRKNIAEDNEIDSTCHNEKISLPAAEKAIYLELEHHLKALDMTIKRVKKKVDNDREKWLAQCLGESKSADEALIKRCSHFDLDIINDTGESNSTSASKICELIVDERQRQLEECKTDLKSALEDACESESKHSGIITESNLETYIARVRTFESSLVQDREAKELVEDLYTETIGEAPIPTGDPQAKLSDEQKSDLHEHLKKRDRVRRLTRELCSRLRSLRYFKAIRDLQKDQPNEQFVVCTHCGKRCSIEDIGVLSSCGHTGCLMCMRQRAGRDQSCIKNDFCKYQANVNNVVEARALGSDDTAQMDGRYFGKKLEFLIELIKTNPNVKEDDRLLVFVQFADLMKKVAVALEENGISHSKLEGSSSKMSKTLEKFQNNQGGRVLLLNVMDESASGANLTNANHAIFLSPILEQTQEKYEAKETQAIGRVKRYGQEKHVHIWRLIVKDTIDEEIFEKRSK